ncbi:hypothetical protein D3C87_1973460 [compost metagenome]
MGVRHRLPHAAEGGCDLLGAVDPGAVRFAAGHRVEDTIAGEEGHDAVDVVPVEGVEEVGEVFGGHRGVHGAVPCVLQAMNSGMASPWPGEPADRLVCLGRGF